MHDKNGMVRAVQENDTHESNKNNFIITFVVHFSKYLRQQQTIMWELSTVDNRADLWLHNTYAY